MRVEGHLNDPHTMLIDGRDVSVDGAKLDTIESGAEVNNLTDSQAASLTSGLHSSWHNHDTWYYRKVDFQTAGSASIIWDNITGKPTTYPSAEHNHNDLYNTKAEIVTLLSGKANLIHNHDDAYFTQSQLTSGQLDTRYYAKSEIDEKIHAASIGVQGAVSTYSDLPSSNLISGMIYIVKQTASGHEEGFYQWNGTQWTFLVNNTGVETHNQLSGLNDGDYKHLSQTEYSQLTGSASTDIHNHDTRYNTKTEITTLLAGKSDTTHNHDAAYYTKTLLDGGQLDSRYFTESEVTTLLSNKASLTHNHNDLYNTKAEITDLLSGKASLVHDHNSLYYTQTLLDSGQLDNRYYTKTNLKTSGEAIITWANISNTPSTYTPSVHDHNDLYNTKAEITTLLAGKSDISHNHDTAYYTKALLDGGQLDSRYFTESEVTTLLSGKSDTGHLHDDRYNTKAEITSLLSGKSDTTHNHDTVYYTKTNLQTSGSASVHWNNITNKPTFGGNNWLLPVVIKYYGTAAPAMSSGYTAGDRVIWYSGTGANQHIYVYVSGSTWTDTYTPAKNDTVMVNNDGDSNPAQYWYNGTSWIKIADPDYADHGSLSGLGDDDHTQYLNIARHGAVTGNPHTTTLTHVISADATVSWTKAQLDTLLNGSDVSLHNHNTLYYTKTLANSTFAPIAHTHDDRYYTESEINAYGATITYSFISGNDPNTDVTAAELEKLTNGSNADGLHTHTFTASNITLDSAYGTYGGGRTIAIDNGPVELTASAGFAPLSLPSINYTPTQWVSGGQICFRDNELFYYDGGRGRWLSVASHTYNSSINNNSATGYFYIDNIVMSSTAGFCMPFDGTVVGCAFCNSNANSSGQIYIQKGGTTIATLYYSGLESHDMSINADFTAGSILQVNTYSYSNPQKPNKPIVTFFVRRRI